MLDERDLQLLGALMDKKLAPIQSDIADLKTDVSGLKSDVSGLKSDVSDLKSDVSHLQSNYAGIRLEMENVIKPQLSALAEGQKTILETLAPKNRVEALEDEVSFLKQVVKTLAAEVNALKAAQ